MTSTKQLSVTSSEETKEVILEDIFTPFIVKKGFFVDFFGRTVTCIYTFVESY
ncbi:MAG: hypothetical protein LBQ01_04715 [Prevotellaceae bacterium]|nr:hypothetical protein [Prevotellaceae bacterium]